MELGDAGVAGLEHLDVDERGDRLDVLGGQHVEEAVHQLAPGPEAVLARAAPLGHPGHRPLEGVAVQVRHRRQQRAAGEPLRRRAAAAPRLDRGDRGRRRASRARRAPSRSGSSAAGAKSVVIGDPRLAAPPDVKRKMRAQGKGGTCRGADLLIANATVATMEPGGAPYGLIAGRGDRGPRRPDRRRSGRPRRWRGGAGRAGARPRRPAGDAGADRLPHPRRLRRRPRARVRDAARGRELRGHRPRRRRHHVDGARDARGRRGRRCSPARCRGSTR